MWLIITALVVVVTARALKSLKTIRIGAVAMVTGAPKTGKSTFATWLAIKELKKRRRQVRLHNMFHAKQKKEMPLLYSNVPLAIKHVPIDEDILTRKKRMNYGSVVLIQEASLVADSMTYKDAELNERLSLFCKLIGHETKGGCLIYDSQCVADMHFAFKRVLSEYFHIRRCIKWIPFFIVAEVREMLYSEEGQNVNVSTGDSEELFKKVLIPKSVWRTFDCFCYSELTDNLEVSQNEKTCKKLKTKKIVSFRKWVTPEMKGEYSHEQKENK